jgi:hypothetical protein
MADSGALHGGCVRAGADVAMLATSLGDSMRLKFLCCDIKSGDSGVGIRDKNRKASTIKVAEDGERRSDWKKIKRDKKNR